MNLTKHIETAICASLDAGKEIIEVYNSNDFNIKLKSDNSPLTLADELAHKAIVKKLSKTGIPILSEEGDKLDYEIRKNWEYFWLVDPLDGTKEFIKRNNEFTVNIALIHNDTPVLGVIYVPVSKELYFASKEIGSFKKEELALECKSDIVLSDIINSSIKLPVKEENHKFTIVGSRSHMSPETINYIDKLKESHEDVNILSKGSSLNLCMVAEGRADVYPRFGPTMEWDTAAGHAIALYAGFKVTMTDEKSALRYNKKELLNPWFIVNP